jgi:hypothetical protein
MLGAVEDANTKVLNADEDSADKICNTTWRFISPVLLLHNFRNARRNNSQEHRQKATV